MESAPGPALGLVRGVTLTTPLVRRSFQVIEGTWPKSGEVLVGRLAAAKLGRRSDELAIGRVLDLFGFESPLVRRWAGVRGPAED